MKKGKNNWMSVVVFVLLCALIVAVIVGLYCDTLKINDGNTMIGFIGTLAAFVVINNFSQVADIRNNTEKELDRVQKTMEDIAYKTDNRLDEMKNEIEKKAEESSKKIEKIDQKFDALLSGELDIVSIKEKYKYEVKDVTLIENAVYGKYYVEEVGNQSPVIVYVQGKKNNLKVEEVAYNDYMKRFPNKDDFDRLNSILGPLGIK